MKATCLEILPSCRALVISPSETQPDRIEDLKVEAFPYMPTHFISEIEEHEIIKENMEWSRIQSCGQTFYSKYSVYPDLYVYYDPTNKTGPRNPISKMFTTSQVVHGPAVMIRVEPPTASSHFALAGQNPIVSPPEQNKALWTPFLGQLEIQETCAFYANTSFHDLDQPRFFARME